VLIGDVLDVDAREADPDLRGWRARWETRRRRQPQPAAEAADLMRRHNPAVIPRNHKVEEALQAAEAGDMAPLDRLLDVLARPYDHGRTDTAEYTTPDPGGRHYRTFCGT
jgi:uncharacterized protein YdiU (UPF0061 family)